MTTSITSIDKMSDIHDDERGYSSKLPRFKGRKKDWPFFKAKMESVLSRKGCVDLLGYMSAGKKDILKDKDSPQDITEEQKSLRTQNRLAAGLLMDCIDTDDDDGKEVFCTIDSFKVPGEFSGGHFVNAWNALIDEFEDPDDRPTSDIRKAYYELNMGADEKPTVFLMKLGEIRRRLKARGEVIADDAHAEDILAKLPRSTVSGQLGPYQSERLRLEQQKKKGTPYTLEDVKSSIKTVYKRLNPDDDDDGIFSVDKQKGDRALIGFNKQFKGKCHGCGKYGHKKSECRSGGASNGNSGGNSSSNRFNQSQGGGGGSEQRKCHYCKKKGHLKKDCFKRKAALEAKGDAANLAHETVALVALDPTAELTCYEVDDGFFDNFISSGEEDRDEDETPAWMDAAEDDIKKAIELGSLVQEEADWRQVAEEEIQKAMELGLLSCEVDSPYVDEMEPCIIEWSEELMNGEAKDVLKALLGDTPGDDDDSSSDSSSMPPLGKRPVDDDSSSDSSSMPSLDEGEDWAMGEEGAAPTVAEAEPTKEEKKWEVLEDAFKQFKQLDIRDGFYLGMPIFEPEIALAAHLEIVEDEDDSLDGYITCDEEMDVQACLEDGLAHLVDTLERHAPAPNPQGSTQRQRSRTPGRMNRSKAREKAKQGSQRQRNHKQRRPPNKKWCKSQVPKGRQTHVPDKALEQIAHDIRTMKLKMAELMRMTRAMSYTDDHALPVGGK